MSTPRKKVRPGRLELSEDGATLDVHYETVEVTVLPDGREVIQSGRTGVKSLPLVLPEDGDLKHAAQMLVDSCKLLHPQRVGEVAALLQQAATRQREAAGAEQQRGATPSSSAVDTPQRVTAQDREALRLQQQQYLAAAAASAIKALSEAAATASLSQLDEYLEALYEEDMGIKAAAAAAVAQLCRQPSGLEALMEQPAVLQALARLLREDARKGDAGQLCVSLLATFLALAHVPNAHPLLQQNQVGSLTMELLDLELQRAEHWQQREGVPVADVGAKLLAREPLAPAEARLAAVLARQEPALYLGLSLLLSMAEQDVRVEQKMVNKGLPNLLLMILDRGSLQLLQLATTFLRRLSLYAENCWLLREAEVVAQLAALVPGDGGPQLASVLRLLHNLSFDEGMRQQMVDAGMISKAAALLKADELQLGGGASSGASMAGHAEGPQLKQLALGLLYHLSLQDKHRSMFLYTDAIPSLYAMLLRAPPPLEASSPVLAQLLISLAASQRVAEELSRGARLEQMLALAVGPAEPPVAAALQTAGGQASAAEPADESPAQLQLEQRLGGPGADDLLLWRLLRALAEHDSEPLRARFAPALERLARLLMARRLPPATFAEALGCFACLDIPGHNYSQLLRATGLHTFFAELASGDSSAVQPEVVEAAGLLCSDAASAEMLASAGLVEKLHTLMLHRMDDDDFVLATTSAAARLLAQPATRAALLAHPEIAAHFAELLQHPVKEVARAADAALDAVAAGSDEWAASVRRLKFEAHNHEWLQAVRTEPLAASDGGQLIGADWGFTSAEAPLVAAG